MLKELWGKFAYYTFLFLLIIFGLLFGELKINASTLTPYDTYYQQMELNNYSNMGTSSRFSCQLVPSSVSNIGPFDTGLINRDYTSNVYMFDFAFNTSLSANTYYDIVINNSKSTFTSKINNNTVTFNNGTSISNLYDSSNNNAITLISATRNSNKKVTIRIFVGRATSLWSLHISTDSGQDKLTSGTQWNISSITIESVDVSGTDAIVDNNNANTNSIINNQQENTQNIINNNNQNTQNLIDNQNQLLGTNCSNLIDKTKFEVGHYNGSSSNTRVYLHQNIYLQSGTYYFKTNLGSGKNYNLVVAVSQFPSNSTKIYESGWKTNGTLNFTINQSGYFTIMLRYNDDSVVNLNDFLNYNYMLSKEDKPFCEYGSIISKQDETTNSVNNLNNTISNDDIDDPSDFIDDMRDMLPTNGTITQLIALPITLYQKILNNVNGTCNSMNLGNLYGTNLIMPCIEVSNYLGSTLWNTIDLIISGVFVLTIAKKMIKAFNNFTSMKEGDVIND